MDIEEKKFREELIDLGVPLVRHRVDNASYNERRKEWAVKWLTEQEANRRTQVDADAARAMAPNTAIARWTLVFTVVAAIASVAAATIAYMSWK